MSSVDLTEETPNEGQTGSRDVKLKELINNS